MRHAVTALAAVAAWFLPTAGFDLTFEWLTARAILDGHDPTLTLTQLADLYGVDRIADFPHPRLPGSLLLQLPVGLLPLGWVEPLAGPLVAAVIVWTAFEVELPPGWWLIVGWPAWSVVYYGNLAAVVTLLLAVTFTRRSALALGAATVLRVWPWFVGLALFVAGERRLAVKAAGWFVGLNLAGLMLPGVSVAGTVDVLSRARVVEDVSVNLGGAPLWLAVPAALVCLWLVWKRPRTVAMSVGFGLLLSPVVWLGYLTVLMVPLGTKEKPPASKETRGYASPEGEQCRDAEATG